MGRQIHSKLDKTYRKILGYMPQHQGLYNQFTGLQFLNYMAILKQIPKNQIPQEIENVASYANLTKELNKKIGAYSGGMKQRLLIANTIIGNPKLLIFDEPTAGLDPKERIRVRHLISKLAEDKIVIATHIVSDIENIAHQILILKDGVLLENNNAEQLIDSYCPSGDLEDVYMQIFGDQEDA